MGQTVVFEGLSNRVVAAVWSALVRRGYYVVRSFDLQEAISHHPDGCDCSYHGTSQCTCQYVVLLAYPPVRLPAQPRVITVHANEQTTWVTLLPERSIGGRETHALLAALAEARAGPEADKRAAASCAASAVPATNS